METQLESGALFWGGDRKSEAFLESFEALLPLAKRVPLRYWCKGMLFAGAGDDSVSRLTAGKFPKRLVTGMTHPVYALRALQGQVGFKVCPCSSHKPFDAGACRYIAKGCRLLHTGRETDRNSYLVEAVCFNIPRSMAPRLRFMGQVPDSCLKSGGATKPSGGVLGRKRRP